MCKCIFQQNTGMLNCLFFKGYVLAKIKEDAMWIVLCYTAKHYGQNDLETLVKMCVIIHVFCHLNFRFLNDEYFNVNHFNVVRLVWFIIFFLSLIDCTSKSREIIKYVLSYIVMTTKKFLLSDVSHFLTKFTECWHDYLLIKLWQSELCF